MTMMERRPHWTDDLIEAVIRAESDAHDYEYRAMAAIAAVEDWQENEHELAMQEMRGHKAAIQRVRELHHFVVDEIETREGPEDVQHCSECGYIPTDEEPCPTLVALNTATWLRSLTDGGAE